MGGGVHDGTEKVKFKADDEKRIKAEEERVNHRANLAGSIKCIGIALSCVADKPLTLANHDALAQTTAWLENVRTQLLAQKKEHDEQVDSTP